MTDTVNDLLTTHLTDQNWLIQIGIIIAISLILSAITQAYLRRLHKRHENEEDRAWYEVIIEAVSAPAQILIWLISLSFILEVAQKGLELNIIPDLGPQRRLLFLLGIAWSVMRFIRGAEDQVLAASARGEKSIDHTTVDAISKFSRLCVMVITLLVVLQTLGFSISGVLAFGGVSGIAIGFAAKDLLANFFGGLMIFLDRPFNVGDAVRSPDQNIEGVVERIGWRLTQIRTFEKRPLYVPNATFLNISVENISRMTHRRIREHIGIRYDDAAQMQRIVDEVKSMLLAHESVDQSNAVVVNFDIFNASSMDFLVQCYTKTTDFAAYHAIRQEILLKVLNIIENNDAECAFPTSTLHIQGSANNALVENPSSDSLAGVAQKT